jgi:hypothetical protein
MANMLEIGNYPPPMCERAIQTYLLEKELIRRGHTYRVLKIDEGREINSSEYTDVQKGFNHLYKILRHAWQGFRCRSHVNGETWKGYILALLAALLARLFRQPAALTFMTDSPKLFSSTRFVENSDSIPALVSSIRQAHLRQSGN